MGAEAEFISVVIPTRDRRAILEKCLAALRAQTFPPDRFEVVVVDDGSADGTPEMLAGAARGMANLRHFTQAAGGPAKARNLGIRNARGPLILFTGDDCVAAPSLLTEHARVHGRERNVAVLGHIDWHPDLEVTPFMEYVGKTHQFTFPAIELEKRNVPFNFFYTSNISLRKELLPGAGAFDEEFTDAVCEDAELGYRLWRSGVRIVYHRQALTYHYHAVTLGEFIQRQLRMGKAAVTLAMKHPEISSIVYIDEAFSPEVRHRFYDAVLTYYRAAGMQIALSALKGESLDESRFAVPLEDILKGWGAKAADRISLSLARRTEAARMWEREHVKARLDCDEARRKLDELDRAHRALLKELEHYRDFAEKVKATPPYRFYKALKALLGRAED